jgi:YegS/Rv2252/BmrU family lipid kinase
VSPLSPAETIIIHNPKSGRRSRQEQARKLLKYFSQQGYEIVTTQYPGHATEIGRQHSGKGKAAVVCVGGDGTLGEAVQGLDPNIRFGFFPTGTVNLFAMNLHIPSQADSWLEMFQKGRLKEVYVGEANGASFLNVGSVGYDALVVAKVSTKVKQYVHEGAYILRACQEFWSYRIPHLSVSLDGKKIEHAILGVIVGKGEYFAGPYSIFPEADLGKPNLNVAIIFGDKKSQLLSFGIGLITGKLSKMNNVHLATAKTILVDSEPSSHVELDGDAFCQTPIQFSVNPLARKVLVPF